MRLALIATLAFLAGFSIREWLESTPKTNPVVNDELVYLDDFDQHWLDLETLEYLAEGE